MTEVGCPICGVTLKLTIAKSRKSKTPRTFLMLACPKDGRHFRGFMSDRDFVQRTLDAAEDLGHEASAGKGT